MTQLLLIFGLIIRLFLIPVPGFKADIAFWKGWGLAVADKGILWLANNTNYNYPPGFAYILYTINKIYAFFKNPYDINQYWLDTNTLYLFLLKSITIISDIGIVLLILAIAKKIKFKWGWLLALFYFLNPVAILDGVIWGQVDQFGVFLFLSAIYLLLLKKPGWSSVVFAISFLMKFQNIIFIPLYYLFIYREYSWDELIKSLRNSVITCLIVCLPFWLNHQSESLIRLITINSDWFPWYSLNAFNFWWIMSGMKGMEVCDKTLVLGILNAKQTGFIFFSFTYAISVLGLYLAKKENLFKQLIIGCILVVFAFFHILTQSHERYLYHLLVLIPIMIMFDTAKNLLKSSIFLLFFSIGMFLNMYLSIAMNYPDQVIWPVTATVSANLSFLVSLFQIGLFIYFILTYIINNIKIPIQYFLILLSIIVVYILGKNINYILSKPISLTSLSPIYSRQDYLTPAYNKTVEASRGVFFWNRLSNNYYFYEKGIGSHADSIIIYNLGKRFSRFKTDFGMDTEAAAEAKAFFIIEGDNKVLFSSQSKGRFDTPGITEVDVTHINNLTLKIVKDGNSNYGAHADWFNPELIR